MPDARHTGSPVEVPPELKNGLLLAQAACVRHACAMCSLAIVITIVQSFSLSLFWPTRLACAMRACVRHA